MRTCSSTSCYQNKRELFSVRRAQDAFCSRFAHQRIAGGGIAANWPAGDRRHERCHCKCRTEAILDAGMYHAADRRRRGGRKRGKTEAETMPVNVLPQNER